MYVYYTNIAGHCIQAALTLFLSMTQLREMENHHHEEVTELAITTLERFAKSQLEGELLDDLRTVS